MLLNDLFEHVIYIVYLADAFQFGLDGFEAAFFDREAVHTTGEEVADLLRCRVG